MKTVSSWVQRQGGKEERKEDGRPGEVNRDSVSSQHHSLLLMYQHVVTKLTYKPMAHTDSDILTF